MSVENRRLQLTYLCPALLRIPQERAIIPDNCCFYDRREGMGRSAPNATAFESWMAC